jgi:hypothetical protein
VALSVSGNACVDQEKDLRPAQEAVMITAALIVRMLKGSSTDLRRFFADARTLLPE